ncbi:ribulose-phosphate 3-epimerase [Pseudactinotalea sp. HY158]|uniref:ribulose-phosphate 3-epimerase n=1 Tax=unclassified Pseudactinotalea TaxID=2649176 RepID=UPI00129C6862|nr:ribulose-phosphate 3-epimerase [Pseudactinotalea sp. HY158]MPV49321.1 ribulose-phosphate 3-epimerase [Pseudactinotalea sp. HY160]QGH69385.1 ribulose-phosphate 3-epimerase [Pseudactinotalea sp. HY158]
MTIRISPSVLNSDLADLAGEVARIGNADFVHLDVMDSHFVPNLTFGLPVVERLLQRITLPADVHLMIADPDTWAPEYARAGAASVTFHAEASAAPVRLARELRAAGARAGIALKPATDIAAYVDLLPEFDMVLLMTVEPGFGGQSFIEGTLGKIARTRAAVDATGRDIWVQVDGGVSRATIGAAARAGADMFVAGSAVYSAADPNAEIEALRRLAQAERTPAA